jgi:hypothetical protein
MWQVGRMLRPPSIDRTMLRRPRLPAIAPWPVGVAPCERVDTLHYTMRVRSSVDAIASPQGTPS